MATLPISSKQALAFLFQRQHLSQPAADPMAVMRDQIVVQTQYHASLPGTLWARTAHLSPDWVDQALHDQKAIVKFWTIRHTLHTVASIDLPLMVQAVGQHLQREFDRRWDLSPEQFEEADNAILEALGDSDLSRAEIQEATPQLGELLDRGWGRYLTRLAYQGKMVFAKGKRFARREVWLPDQEWKPIARQEAQKQLFLRYLVGYGPATLKDFAHWAGLRQRDAGQIVADCEADILPVDIPDWQGEFYIRREDEDAIRSQPEIIPEICLLPKFDALSVGYKDKTRFLDEADYKRVYRIAAQIEAVLLFNGRVAATWRMKAQKRLFTLTIEPHRKFTRNEQRLLQQTVERLADFHSSEDVQIAEI